MQNKSFFDDDDDEDDSQLQSISDLQYRPASPRAAASKAGRSSTTGYGGGRQSSVTGAVANTSARGYASTRAGSPSLEDILGDDEAQEGGAKERNIQKLIRCWQNEMNAPELLRYPKRLVLRMVKDLVHRKRIVKEANQMVGENEGLYLQASLVATECMRTAYVLKAFQRCRIYKIEQFADYYLGEEDREERMSRDELSHAEEYSELRKQYMKSSGREMFGHTKDMPVLEPDFSQAVFVHVLRECGPVLLPDGALLPLEKDTQHMFRYSTIRSCLERGELELM